MGSKIRNVRCSYIGGHTEFYFGMPFYGTVVIYEKGLVYKPNVGSHKFVGFTIPLESIITAEYKNEKDIEKDVTLTRLLLLGIYAFGVKKKKVEKHDYLILNCNIDGVENKIIFEIVNANPDILVNDILKLKKKYNLISNNNVSDENNILEQIKKLGELKTSGVLTTEEFNKKKTELLSRI
nr:SHOCT domain-containing protein [Clostridium niameyense]